MLVLCCGLVRGAVAMADRPLGNRSLRIVALDDAILWIGLAVLLFLHKGEGGEMFSVGLAQIGAIGVFAAMILLRGRFALSTCPIIFSLTLCWASPICRRAPILQACSPRNHLPGDCSPRR